MKQLIAHILQLFPQLTAASERVKTLTSIVASRDATIATLQNENAELRAVHGVDASAAKVLAEKVAAAQAAQAEAEAQLAALNAEAADAAAQLALITALLNANPDVPIEGGQVVAQDANTAPASDEPAAGGAPPSTEALPPADTAPASDPVPGPHPEAELPPTDPAPAVVDVPASGKTPPPAE